MISNYTGISGSRVAYLVAAELKRNRKALIVVSSGRIAERLASDLAFFVPEAFVSVMPEEEKMTALYEARGREPLVQRMKCIQALAKTIREGETAEEMIAVIAPVSALLKPTVSRERFASTMIKLRVGMRIDPDDLKRHLVDAGYEFASLTESAGEFSSRGGIMDVFSPSHDNPIRIEFFDDEIDSIRFYDADTQRSVENTREVLIGPAAEFIPTAEEKAAALGKIDGHYDERVAEIFERGTNLQLYSDLIDYFDIDKHYLWEYARDGINIISNPTRIIADCLNEKDKKCFEHIYRENCTVYTPFPEDIEGVDKPDRVVNVTSRQVSAFNGQIDVFAKELEYYLRNSYEIRIVCEDEGKIERIKEYLEIAEVSGSISYCTGNLSSGFIMDDDKLGYITSADIFPQLRKPAKPKKQHKKGTPLQFSDLNKGDYVVHETHGIGRFEGIRAVTADGMTRDYLVIKYAGTDVLYIPTEQLDIIQKYIGSGGSAPALSRLSGGSWRRTRERVRQAVMEIAEDLVKLYAARAAAGGHAFAEDGPWQEEFEADFPYVETDDQLTAAEEIKEDMKKPFPMDRLLCGDVGYGKTEVAARAIFKCVSEGKQAAVLAPTTLLVNQHYHSFLERFANFPFEIGELSRFKSQAQQADVIEGLKDGSVDIVVGTHRLLSKDVSFKDLGLLVIDEEQRFGVQHKEAIKKLKNNIDVLTLSATPIPRTLNMSLSGIKDISTISEPPGERLPVQTYVSAYDENLIKSAVEHELARGGQVYIVNNRINGLKTIAAAAERLVPEARVAIGHGQMDEVTLENTMLDFIEGKYDVLVSTTIIENGIDIPNANTIIIMNADKLGLAQLYQLRGRVGRSNRLAYAYLLYQPQKVLTELAAQRLNAIREFTEFGSGFKLAMKDLELRGAGNVLGEAQSGHIEGIGYELYCKEIERAVRRMKGETVTDTRADITIDIKIPASIPPEYITSETLRLQAYKKIASINSEEDADDLFDELSDRYGDLPTETENLLRVAEIRAHAEMIGIDTIGERGDRIILQFGKENRVSAYMLVLAKEEIGDTLAITSGSTPGLSLYTGKIKKLVKLLELMRALRRALDTSQEAEQASADSIE